MKSRKVLSFILAALLLFNFNARQKASAVFSEVFTFVVSGVVACGYIVDLGTRGIKTFMAFSMKGRSEKK